MLEPHPASIQDRDGGGPLLRASRRIFPFIQRVFADGGYAGEKVAKATLIAVEIVRKNPDQIGFAVNPRRWVVAIKARMGATHFLMKTLPRVASEMALHVLAYNLTRVMNIMGIQPLVAAMRA